MLQWLNEEYESTKEKLVSGSPEVMRTYQGEAQAYKKTIDVLTNARKLGT